MNENDKEKASEFVSHLLSNPNIKNEPILIGEGLLLNFIVQNMSQLKLTFKTPQFFPHLEWNEALQVILSNLYERVAREVLPTLERFIEGADLEVMNKVSESGEFPGDFYREKMLDFVREIFKNKDVRYNFNSVVSMLEFGIIDKYVTEIFRQRGFLYNEMVRVQRTNLELDEYIVFLKMLLILKNTAYLKISGSGKKKNSIIEAVKMPGKFQKFLDDCTVYMRERLPFISEKTASLAVKSNLKNTMTDLEEASSRLIFIFCGRFHNYKPVTHVDRGAESPDKSWFAIARKNSEHYGFDKRMLEELYRIAGDNSW